MEEKIFYDIVETAKLLKFRVSTVKSLIAKDTIIAEKLTNKWFIHTDEIQRFLREKRESMIRYQ